MANKKFPVAFEKIVLFHADGKITLSDFTVCELSLYENIGELSRFSIEAAFNIKKERKKMKKPYAKPAETKKAKPKKKVKKK